MLSSTRAATHIRQDPLTHGAELRAMRAVDQLFAVAPDRPALRRRTVNLLARDLGHGCVLSLTARDGRLVPMAIGHARSRPRHVPELVVADAVSRSAQRERSPVRLSITSPDVARLWFPAAYGRIVDHVRAALAVALLGPRRRVLGTLLVWREGNAPAFDDSDEAFIVSLATRLALALHS